MRGWIGLNALGEGFGIAGVATAYAAVDRGIAAAPAILSAGIWEGLCLGTAQAIFLRGRGVAAVRWIGATTLVAALGYAGSLASGMGDEATGPEPSLGLVLLFAAGLGAVLGSLMGAAQGLTGRGVVRRGRWVLANAVGWMPAMVLIMAAASLVPAGWPLAGVAALGALSGAAAGACIGIATFWALPAGGR